MDNKYKFVLNGCIDVYNVISPNYLIPKINQVIVVKGKRYYVKEIHETIDYDIFCRDIAIDLRGY